MRSVVSGRRQLNLRARILLLVGLALIPSLLLTYGVGHDYRRILREQAQSDALRVARFTAATQSRTIEGARQLLATLAELPEVWGQDSPGCSRLFAQILAEQELYANLGAMDLQGDIFCSGLPMSEPVNSADRAYFQRAIAHQGFSIGEYQVGRITGIQTLNFGYPVRDESDRIVGVVFAALPLEYLQAFPADLNLPEDASITVFDTGGTILARYPNPEVWVGQHVPEAPLVTTVLAVREGTTETQGVDGAERLYGFAPLEGSPEEEPVYVAIGLPSQGLYAEADALLLRNLAGLGLINALALTALLLASEALVLRAIRTLVETARRLAQGDLSARSGLSVAGEVGELAGTLDHMAANLERQQEELQVAEARYRTVVEQLPSTVYSLELNSKPRVRYVSPQIRALTGLSPEEWSADPNSWRKEIHPEDAPTVLYYQLHAHTSGEPFRSEYRILHRDGRTLWVRDQASLVPDPETGGRYLLGVLTDITQRKAAESDLERSERRYRSLVEQLPSIVYVFDHRLRRTTYIAPRIESLLGYTPGEWLEQKDLWEDLLHPDDRLGVLEAWRREDAEARPLDIEYRLRGRDGRYRSFHNLSRQSFDQAGRLETSLGLLNDITQLKEAQGGERRQRGIAEALRDTAESLAGSLDLNEVLDRMLANLTRVLPHDAATIMLIEGPVARVVRARGYAEIGLEAPALALLLPVDETYNLRTMRDGGRALLIPDINADPNWVRTESGSWMRSYVGVPVRVRGRVIGFLNLEGSQPSFFHPDEIQPLQAFADQAGQAIENARLFQDAQRRLAQLQSLRAIDSAISGSVDLRLSLRVLLEHVVHQLGVDAADVLVLDPRSSSLRYAAGLGFRTANPGVQLRLGEGLAGKVALERRVSRLPDLAGHLDEFRRKSLFQAEGFVSYFAVPLVAKGQGRGVLEVFHRSPLAGDPEWIAFLETLAGQAAIAVDNASLFEELQRSNLELVVAYDTTLEGWSRTLDLRDREIEGHSQRVAEMTVRAAERLGVPESELTHIRRGALLHDIGKIAIPDTILLKPGPLDEAEWDVMRQHPQFAFDVLSPIEFLRPALDIPYAHHERWDGSGYPRHMAGDSIPLSARIFAVVDVWDALSSHRPYRAAWPEEKTLAYLREQAGSHFDPRAVDAFFEALGDGP